MGLECSSPRPQKSIRVLIEKRRSGFAKKYAVAKSDRPISIMMNRNGKKIYSYSRLINIMGFDTNVSKLSFDAEYNRCRGPEFIRLPLGLEPQLSQTKSSA